MPRYHIALAPARPEPPRILCVLDADDPPSAIALAHEYFPQYAAGQLSASRLLDIATITEQTKCTAAATKAAQSAVAKQRRADTLAKKKAKRLARTITQRKYHDRKAQLKRDAKLRRMYAKRRLANS